MDQIEIVLRLLKEAQKRRFLEKRETQDLKQSVEIVLETQALFDDGDQHINRDCDPNLGLDAVVGSAEEVLDSEMLLDPFEKEFDLLAITIERSNGQRGNREVVG
jgi:hypothetical protein